MLKERTEIRLGGRGGQGLILAGVILAEAGLLSKYFVCQSQSYGPEARGGASRAEVILDKKEIYYPKTSKLDILLALSQSASDKFYYDLKPNGTFIVDATQVLEVPTNQVIKIPFTEIAKTKLNKIMVANIVALGSITRITDLVTKKNMLASIKKHIPKEFLSLNIEAFELGYEVAEEFAYLEEVIYDKSLLVDIEGIQLSKEEKYKSELENILVNGKCKKKKKLKIKK